MAQYLLNATAIWLLSLVIFDIFLRRESFHGYNRLYLLGSFLLGTLLPLWSWQEDAAMPFAAITKPAEQAAIIKQQIISTTATGNFLLTGGNIIRAIYFTGAFACTVILFKEIILIYRLYKNGKRSKDGVWTIIETGKNHNAFSAFRYVFINDKNNYTDAQLKIILSHEEQHGHSLHAVDLLFMQLAKIIFWFHPLVYLYYNRLMTVHEYQADMAVDTTPGEYGRFLVEQSILGSAPSFSHSFNQSSIKKRITMLAHNRSQAKAKMLLVFPLLLISVVCFTKNAFSDSRKTKTGNKVTYKGNVFELSSLAIDTVFVQDPVTGEMIVKVAEHEPVPVKMNADTIYQDYTIKQMADNADGEVYNTGTLKAAGLRLYLLSNLKDEISRLEDGKYWLGIGNVVVDKNGKVAYYDYAGIQTKSPMGFYSGNNTGTEIDFGMQEKINKKVGKLIQDMPAHIPAVCKGEHVNSLIDGLEFWNLFEIKNGKVVSL